MSSWKVFTVGFSVSASMTCLLFESTFLLPPGPVTLAGADRSQNPSWPPQATLCRTGASVPNARGLVKTARLGFNGRMRAIWTGSIAFGLVNVPVKLYSATESHDVRMHQVHEKDGGRIRNQH